MKTTLILWASFILVSSSFAQSSLNSSWKFFRPGNTGLQGDVVTAIFIDANSNPYIAANTGSWGEGGFAKFDINENKWENFSNVDLPILGGFDNGDIQINDIVEDENGNFWMTKNTGAIKFNPSIGASSIMSFTPFNSSLSTYSTDLDIAPDGSMWFSSGGLVQYLPDTDDWQTHGGSNNRICIQPQQDGSYLVWSADVYFGIVFQYNSATGTTIEYTPSVVGEIAGIPGKDCIDDDGNFWALRMSDNGNWETLEYQRPNGEWVYPMHPYDNISFFIDSFKALENERAVLVTTTGETWYYDGFQWHNYGTWRQGDYNLSIDMDDNGNVWVGGIEGAAKRDAISGVWQRYRLTNTSQIDYFVEDLCIDNQANIWMTGNAGTGIGGIQKFDGNRWTGFNPYTYGLGNTFPFDADNATALGFRNSNNSVVFSPTWHGVHEWNGGNFTTLDGEMNTSKGLLEDSDGRLWDLGEYYTYRYYNDADATWVNMPIVGWGSKMINDPILPGTIWVSTDYEIQRTNGTETLTLELGDFEGSAAVFTGLAVDQTGALWTATWSPFTINGSTLIKYDPTNSTSEIWSYDNGWPFPGEHVRPLTATPDGKIWMQYDAEYPSLESGIFAFDGESIEVFPSSPGGIPNWNVLPNSNIKDVAVKSINNGYELWLSCLGRGIAVLTIIEDETISLNDFDTTPESITVFPNPMKDFTTLKFSNHLKEKFTVEIFDTVGKRVSLQSMQASGSEIENVRIDNQFITAEKIQSGTYFVQIKTNTFNKCVKLIIQ